MVVLDETQVREVAQRIRESGLRNTELTKDLLDHYCCLIEEEMQNGKDFEAAYAIAYEAVNPGGMMEIEEELFFMLNFNKQLNMKRVLYGCASAAAFMISAGLLFRIMHYPGTGEILTVGFSFLLLTSLLLIYNTITGKRPINFATKFRMHAGNIAAFLIATGSIFKYLSYPGANLCIFIGMTILTVFFIPAFFYHLYKRSLAETW